MNTALAFLTRNWEMLALERFGALSELSCIMLTPRFRTSAHVIFLVLRDKSPDPVLVVKVSRLPDGSGSLEREADNLRAVHAARPDGFPSIPRLLAYQEYGGTHLLLETAVAGRVLKADTIRRQHAMCAEAVLAWVTDLDMATAQPPRGAAVALVSLLLQPLEEFERSTQLELTTENLISRTQEVIRPLQQMDFPFVFEHGDLSAPNILLSSEGELGVVDWELAAPQGLPGADLFFAFTYLAFARCRAARLHDYIAAFREAFFGSNAWTQPYIERYSRKLQLPDELLKPLFVASWARYVMNLMVRIRDSDSQPGLDRATAAWLKQNRYFALWQYAVQHAGEIQLLPRKIRISVV